MFSYSPGFRTLAKRFILFFFSHHSVTPNCITASICQVLGLDGRRHTIVKNFIIINNG